ncbi:2-keto-4-pentenoate hydratase/2-oxohepta-3-ene-1,7-dioic acid hydratase (catechol pathway) [Pseudonocardia thermophila]|jgi:2-keto-4-pentenoate hydratase/2-oxohepta-3-ene-1,7-dioic acid hydratase (catechol pathway)|uniref:2-keto-4-pentenoate hydratase/2-oxohepta-3-ene-1,7-dioic acid hydratase (Catechol pathway) n=1 Tax=Pseudonocardia thermophila TaxID=1848 RepID=A0A1M6PN29_PSETH|nr:fumarylacetoacetate hydrolase family protein [Pseudonocardia thermophila]SHK09327.1 2-keto-4-pentenoate hydratase/2-oxohepta-3-ene-1,7-dioic acid hydratase (catechol pathway) [Pseudonocardia thermophila]
MKLVRFGDPGRERPGVLQDDVIVDVSSRIRDYDPRFFAEGGLAHLEEVLREAEALPRVDPATVRIGPPIGRPGKIVCIGLNYADHAEEAGFPVPTEPTVFFKAPNTIVGPYDQVRIPRGGDRTDWEVELGVVIGREARYLPDEAAGLAAVAGFAVVNEMSERGFQLTRGGEWAKGKSCETFNPLGPWLVTPDEIDDVQALDLWLDVNGEPMQRSSTKHMLFSVGFLVWHLSQFMVLEPGDLIDTGTPGGVGNLQDPPRYLAKGDVIELGVTGLGSQRLSVIGADD